MRSCTDTDIDPMSLAPLFYFFLQQISFSGFVQQKLTVFVFVFVLGERGRQGRACYAPGTYLRLSEPKLNHDY